MTFKKIEYLKPKNSSEMLQFWINIHRRKWNFQSYWFFLEFLKCWEDEKIFLGNFAKRANLIILMDPNVLELIKIVVLMVYVYLRLKFQKQIGPF